MSIMVQCRQDELAQFIGIASDNAIGLNGAKMRVTQNRSAQIRVTQHFESVVIQRTELSFTLDTENLLVVVCPPAEAWKSFSHPNSPRKLVCKIPESSEKSYVQ
jgi:hypothetical protein